MLNNIRETIKIYNMISKGDSVIVALSGGADSVALLFCLLEIKNELNFTLSACHVNHKLRGEDSDSDMNFVVKICRENNIPLLLKEIEVKSLQKKHQSTEECARDARYDFFKEISKNSKIATAHTASDNAETVLLNLTRGTALKGLCGIPPVRENIIRPLIYCTRNQIENYCNEKQLSFVTDKTNFSEDYTRNKIRLSIIPRLLEINPSFFDTVSKTTSSLLKDEEYLSRITSEAIEKACKDGKYDVKVLKSYDDVILCKLVSRLLSKNNIQPCFLHINSIVEIIKTEKGKINIAKNKFAIVHNNTFEISEIFQYYR